MNAVTDAIRIYLLDQKYDTVPDDTYSHIDEWLEWYQNDVKNFHHYKLYNGMVMTSQKRYRLGMAKKVCEDWADLLLNEKVAIKAGEYENNLKKILEANNFYVRGNQLVEMAFALGTGAFVEYKDADEEVVIDYIRADMIYPLSWDNGDITECAFGTPRTVNGKTGYIYRFIGLALRKMERNPVCITLRTSILMQIPGRRLMLRRK